MVRILVTARVVACTISAYANGIMYKEYYAKYIAWYYVQAAV